MAPGNARMNWAVWRGDRVDDAKALWRNALEAFEKAASADPALRPRVEGSIQRCRNALER